MLDVKSRTGQYRYSSISICYNSICYFLNSYTFCFVKSISGQFMNFKLHGYTYMLICSMRCFPRFNIIAIHKTQRRFQMDMLCRNSFRINRTLHRNNELFIKLNTLTHKTNCKIPPYISVVV